MNLKKKKFMYNQEAQNYLLSIIYNLKNVN